MVFKKKFFFKLLIQNELDMLMSSVRNPRDGDYCC